MNAAGRPMRSSADTTRSTAPDAPDGRRTSVRRPRRSTDPAAAPYTHNVAGDPHPSVRTRAVNEHSIALAREWRRLGRAATAVAILTSPILFVVLYSSFEWNFMLA